MSEKIEFIPAKDLPVAEGNEVDVLCVENRELKLYKPKKTVYKRVSSLDEIESGKKYILISNGCDNVSAEIFATENFVMAPSVVLRTDGTKTRMGFDLRHVGFVLGVDNVTDMETIGFDGSSVEWTIRRYSDVDYAIGTEAGFLTFASSELFSVTAFLSAVSPQYVNFTDTGDGFTIDNFVGIYLDFDKRGVACGYTTNNNSKFYIYKRV